MTRLDRMIVAQLSPAVQVFFARLVILQILLPLLVWISLAKPLGAQQPSVSGHASLKVNSTMLPANHLAGR
jgi:hypothetical protein